MEVIGWLMFAAPFVGLFILMAVEDSISVVVGIFAVVTVVCVWMLIGLNLVNGRSAFDLSDIKSTHICPDPNAPGQLHEAGGGE